MTEVLKHTLGDLGIAIIFGGIFAFHQICGIWVFRGVGIVIEKRENPIFFYALQGPFAVMSGLALLSAVLTLSGIMPPT